MRFDESDCCSGTVYIATDVRTGEMRTVCFVIALFSSLIAVKTENVANCKGLNFQWNPITANYTQGNGLEGALSVTRETVTTVLQRTCYSWIYFSLQETKYGKFYLQCNDNSIIVNPGTTTNVLITPVSF